ncbi:MAG: hypothetical protein ACOCQR_03280 [bacterium]
MGIFQKYKNMRKEVLVLEEKIKKIRFNFIQENDEEEKRKHALRYVSLSMLKTDIIHNFWFDPRVLFSLLVFCGMMAIIFSSIQSF